VDPQENGRTSTRILSDDQLADYGPWFDNHRRLRELITELEALSLAITENDPAGTANQATPVPDGPGDPQTGTTASAKRGQHPLNLWAALHPALICPGQPQT